MQKNETAKKYFTDGCNCCQAVVLAFAEELGIEKEVLARLSSSFGAGIGGLKEVCGAVSGMCMVLGAKFGYGMTVEPEEKSAHADCIRDAVTQFQKKYGSIICRELKTGDRDRAFCCELVDFAASLTDRLLTEQA